jgi:translocation and assembly module TamB
VADAVAITEGSEPPRRRLRRDWPRRLLNELFAGFVALLFLFAGALVLLDSAPGHRFIVDRLGRFETASGLNIRIGRIDGSIFGKSQLRNVRVSDGRGVFLRKARRPSLDLVTANVAVFTAGGSYRIALGAVAPTVIRVRDA